MIAKINFTFNFVGGQGLKSAVDKLQNALTFNFYANTEIYDDRADATDDSYKILDQQFIKALGIEVPPPVVSDIPTGAQTLSNAETIGKVLTTEIGANETTGTIEYKSFMVQMVGSTQNYFTTVINKNKDVLKQYNNAVRQLISYNRNYVDGQFYYNTTSFPWGSIYGKPSKTQQIIDSIFKDFLKDIEDETEGLVVWMANPSKNFSKKAIRQLKENYISYINSKKGTFQNALTSILNSLVDTQTEYIQRLSRTNVITRPNLKDGTDGLQGANGYIVVYETEGTDKVSAGYQGPIKSTYNEMVDDLTIITNDLGQYLDDITTIRKVQYQNKEYEGQMTLPVQPTEAFPLGEVFDPMTYNSYPDFWDLLPNKRQYFILNQDVIDDKNYETFKNALIGNIINNPAIIGNLAFDFGQQFDAYWKGPRPANDDLPAIKTIYQLENGVANELLEQCTSNFLKKYVVYTPYPNLDKDRLFTYTINPTPIPPQVDLIKSLGLKNNSDTNTSRWNSEVSTDTFIGKVQLL